METLWIKIDTDRKEFLMELLKELSFVKEVSIASTQKTEDTRKITDLAGGWTDEDVAEFERNTAYFNQIDEELWK
jgi:hypothetical protein